MEQRQTAPAQDTERAVVDLETFERVWRRVMPNQDMSPIQVGAPTGPGTGAERQAERIPAPAQLQNQDQGAAPAGPDPELGAAPAPEPSSRSGGAGRWAGSAAGGVDGRGLDGPQDLSGAGPAGPGQRGPDPERPGGGAAQDGPAAGGLLVPAHRRLLPLLQPAHPAGLPPGPQRCGNSSCRSRSGDGYASGRQRKGTAPPAGGCMRRWTGRRSTAWRPSDACWSRCSPCPAGVDGWRKSDRLEP